MKHVVVFFGPAREYELAVNDEDAAALNREAAREWLANEFETLECSPSNPMGKILVLDMILNIAKYGGEARFREPGAWAGKFAAAVVAALERPVVRVDVAGFVVG